MSGSLKDPMLHLVRNHILSMYHHVALKLVPSSLSAASVLIRDTTVLPASGLSLETLSSRSLCYCLFIFLLDYESHATLDPGIRTLDPARVVRCVLSVKAPCPHGQLYLILSYLDPP